MKITMTDARIVSLAPFANMTPDNKTELVHVGICGLGDEGLADLIREARSSNGRLTVTIETET